MWLTPHATADTFSVMRESGRAAGATESPLSVSVYLHRPQPYNLSQPTRFPQPMQTWPATDASDASAFDSRTLLCCASAELPMPVVNLYEGLVLLVNTVMFTYTKHVVHLQDK